MLRESMQTALIYSEENKLPSFEYRGQTMEGLSLDSKSANQSNPSDSLQPSHNTINTNPLSNMVNLFTDAQLWVESDMNKAAGSFSMFCSSPSFNRMTGHLRSSPPFVKMSMADILACDRKSIFLLAFLAPSKRHSVVYCCNALKDLKHIDGSLASAEVCYQY
jgi:hypothetical protein